ncbi:MAG: Hsp33 family molecular chaperone [Methylobacteriaceae bacterium]|nr:Hsp33 family molecular chaperone [Methylobacteriaceae bacterium]
MSGASRASRPVSDAGRDDTVLPFAVKALDIRGRVVRLGPSVDHILTRHAYPEAIARVVGEACALTVLLGSSLKGKGRFQLQTKSDGPLEMLVVDFDAPDRLRAFARFDTARLAAACAAGRASGAALLGTGHLALTIDPGGDLSRYQGVVSLDGRGLEAAAHQYFRQSEQIPTLMRLAVAQRVTGRGASWRAGGLMVQFLPVSPERQRQPEFDPGDAPTGTLREAFVEDEAWVEARTLAATTQDHELIDPMLSSERLLYRLFHERGVEVFEAHEVRDACRCSRQGIEAMLRRFTPQERRDMIGGDGKIGVTCEFCSAHREFDPAQFEAEPVSK